MITDRQKNTPDWLWPSFVPILGVIAFANRSAVGVSADGQTDRCYQVHYLPALWCHMIDSYNWYLIKLITADTGLRYLIKIPVLSFSDLYFEVCDGNSKLCIPTDMPDAPSMSSRSNSLADPKIEHVACGPDTKANPKYKTNISVTSESSMATLWKCVLINAVCAQFVLHHVKHSTPPLGFSFAVYL